MFYARIIVTVQEASFGKVFVAIFAIICRIVCLIAAISACCASSQRSIFDDFTHDRLLEGGVHQRSIFQKVHMTHGLSALHTVPFLVAELSELGLHS